MGWSTLNVRTKIISSFSVVLILLSIIAVTGVSGIRNILENGATVEHTDNLRAELLQREIDHLKWNSQLENFVYDDHVHELNIGLDHTKCGFGKWFYGIGRQNAEKAFPELKDQFSALEVPHKNLHASARKILDSYRKSNITRV